MRGVGQKVPAFFLQCHSKPVKIQFLGRSAGQEPKREALKLYGDVDEDGKSCYSKKNWHHS